MEKNGRGLLVTVGGILILILVLGALARIARTNRALLEPVAVSCVEGHVVGYSVDFTSQQAWQPEAHRQPVFEIELADHRHINVASAPIAAPPSFRGPVQVRIRRGTVTGRERYYVQLSGACFP